MAGRKSPKGHRERRSSTDLDDDCAVAEEDIVGIRTKARLTQHALAGRMGTTQPVIARLESGRIHPSLRTLEKLARATGSRLTVRFEPKSGSTSNPRRTTAMPTPSGYRVIGIRHALRRLREGHGLVGEGIMFPDEAATNIKSRAVVRVQRNVNRTLRLVARAIETGEMPEALRTGIISVRVGNESFLTEIEVPEAIRALGRRRR